MHRTATTIGLILGGGLLFVGGVAAGWRVGHGEPLPAREPNHTTLAKQAPDEPVTGPRVDASLARAGADTIALRPLERLALFAELNRRLRAKFSLSPVNYSQKLDENFVRLFAVTPVEREEFESLVATTDAGLARAAANVARVEPQADGTFKISIPPFPEEGGRIYDQFVAKVGEIMGPERTAYMKEMKILDENGIQQFDRFGIMQTTVELNPAAATQSHWFMQFDEKTTLTTRTARLDLRSFRSKYPAIYENMRAAGQVADLPTP